MNDIFNQNYFLEINNKFQIFDVHSPNDTMDIYYSLRIDNKKEIYKIENAKNYFYIPQNLEQLKKYYPFYPKNKCIIQHYNYKFIPQKEIKRYKYTYEADIRLENKIFTEIYSQFNTNPDIKFRYNILDIEVFRNGYLGMPDYKNKEHYINMIGLYDNYVDMYFLFVIGNKSDIKNIELKQLKNYKIFIMENEKQLLDSFVKLIKKLEPDIITGWNVINFDIRYICLRMKEFYPEIFNNFTLINNNPPYLYSGKKDDDIIYFIPGIVIMDYYLLYKKYIQNQKESYTLDYITKIELGENIGGKMEYDGILDDLYKNDVNKFIEYNSIDVHLIRLLNDKLLFLELANELKELSSCPLHTFNFHNTLKFTDSIISLYLKKQNPPMVLKTTDISENEEVSYSGGFVMNPKSGFHDWIIDLDVSSMYPSIIRTLNVSPETYICKISNITNEIREYLTELRDDIGDTVVEIDLFNKKTNIKLIDLKNKLIKICGGVGYYTISCHGTIFSKKENGVIPAIQEHLLNQRSIYKKMLKK